MCVLAVSIAFTRDLFVLFLIKGVVFGVLLLVLVMFFVVAVMLESAHFTSFNVLRI